MQLAAAGEIAGGIHPYIGQEAIAAGICSQLAPADLLTSTHRGHGHVLARGVDPGRLFAELAGRSTGLNRGRGGSMHAADFSLGIYGANAIVGAAGAIATGAVWASRRLGRDGIGVCFFGDGAVNEGALLEALNLASLWSVPVLFVCENNGYATTMPVGAAVAGRIGARAEAFGLIARQVDGQDVFTVHEVAAAVLARVRDERRPAWLECSTFRFGAHHTYERRVRTDYRSADELARARQRDPVELAASGLSSDERADIDIEIEESLDKAVEFALGSPRPDPADPLRYLYASGLQPRRQDGGR